MNLRRHNEEPLSGIAFLPDERGAAAEEDEEGDGQGADQPEYVVDPDGHRVRVEDLWNMRRESTARYEEASQLRAQAEAAEARANRVVDTILTKTQAAAGESATKTPTGARAKPTIDLSDLNVDDLDQAGMGKLAERIGLGLDATKAEILSRLDVLGKNVNTMVDDKITEAQIRQAVHAANMEIANDYFQSHGVRSADARKDVLDHLRSLPRTGKWKGLYGTEDDNGYFRYNQRALLVADRAVRGDELVAAAEARAKKEGFDEYRKSNRAGDSLVQPGGGSVDLSKMTFEEKMDALDQMSYAQQTAVLDQMSDEELFNIPMEGFQRQLADRERGYVPATRR